RRCGQGPSQLHLLLDLPTPRFRRTHEQSSHVLRSASQATPHRGLWPRSPATTAVARRAAATGALPDARETRYAAENASPAPVGSTSPLTGRAGTATSRPA